MSSDRDPSSKAPASLRARPSLKELAERVSKAPPSLRPSSSDLPATTLKSSPPVSTPIPSTATPLPLSRPSGAGVAISAVATPVPPPMPSDAGPPSVGPSSVGSGSSGPASLASVPPALLSKPAEPTSKAPATLPTGVTPIAGAKSSNSGVWAGVGVALVGVAAAAGIFLYMKAKTPAPQVPIAHDDTAQAPTQEATKAEPDPKPQGDQPAQAAKSDDDGKAVDINKLGDATATPGGPAVPGPLPANPGALAAEEKKGPQKIDPDGTLDEEMRKRAGSDDEKKVESAPDPAAATPKNLPDNPPQGAVTAGMASAKGAARACVQGADGDSTATVTFGSTGAAQSVSVGGWAAGKPAAECVKGALKSANVGAFSKPTFTVSVTIRP